MDGPLISKEVSKKFRYMLEQPESLKLFDNIIYQNKKSLKLVNQQVIGFKPSSSETTRETSKFFNFGNFLELSDKKVSIDFLTWFVGFTEGCGTFIISKNQLFFIINEKEERILLKIKTKLGFGKVSAYENYFRYIVSKKEFIVKLFHIFNGNLLLEKSNNSFNLWAHLLNLNIKPKFRFSKNFNLSTSSWFSGFTAAEGYFTGLIQENDHYKLKYSFKAKFRLSQDFEFRVLNKIRTSFGTGRVVSRDGFAEIGLIYICDSFIGCNVLVEYFERYPLLHFQKTVAFKKWKKYLNYISLTKKDQLDLEKIKRLLESINQIESNDEDIVQSIKEI